MISLKKETLNQCFSLLREYIDQGPKGRKYVIAKLAFNQLRTITAGLTNNDPVLKTVSNSHLLLSCNGKPRANASTEQISE